VLTCLALFSPLAQVDCLVALGQRDDAITLLERNLDMDGWRRTLRRRLREPVVDTCER
jgi:hypothetical protein